MISMQEHPSLRATRIKIVELDGSHDNLHPVTYPQKLCMVNFLDILSIGSLERLTFPSFLF